MFQPLADASGVVLAVSGGPDSIALLHLAARWRGDGVLPLWVATVDHGLQPGSDAVAAEVVRTAEALGLPGTVLNWAGPKPATGIQDAARAARYDLLARFAASVGASHLVTAHTRDDQAETVLMRLAAGSGLLGLAAMRPMAPLGRLVLARPFLGLGKDVLVGLCRRHEWPFVEDAANGDARYARARWRALTPALEAEGLTARRLARLADRAARAEAALSAVATGAAARTLRQDGPASRSFDAMLLAEPDEIVLRVLGEAVTDVGRPPRLRQMEMLLDAIRRASREGVALRRSLGGCTVAFDGTTLLVAAEPPRRHAPRGAMETGALRSR